MGVLAFDIFSIFLITAVTFGVAVTAVACALDAAALCDAGPAALR